MAAAVSLLLESEPSAFSIQFPKTVQQWPGASLAHRAAQLGRLAAKLFLNSIQCSLRNM
jgi:hypothetical protein